MKHIAKWSGGYDSSCMVVMICEKNLPLDYIVFCDTLAEFEEMHEYIKKFEAYIKRRFNKIVTIVKPKDTFEDWAFSEVTSGERKGKIRGLPLMTVPCYWKRESKVNPFERWIKDNKIGEHNLYIGYTYTELQRANVEANNQLYPLIDFKMTEDDVRYFLKERSIDNPLYKHFNRTGCYFCPKQRVEDFYNVWKYHPKKWEQMKKYESKARYLKALNTSFCIHGSVEELEMMFVKKEKQLTFEFPDEHDEEEYCFCKI